VRSALALREVRAHEQPTEETDALRPEVLERIGVTAITLWQWQRAGKFPTSREINNKTAWLEDEINEWMRSRPARQFKKAGV
jgi:predicted DNA-binding transcriptional regulator AlpA